MAIAPVKISSTTERSGTKVTLWPDAEIFPSPCFDYEMLRTRLAELAYLSPRVRIQLSDSRTGRSEEFFFEDGVADFIRDLMRHRTSSYLPANVLHSQGKSGDMEYAGAAGFATNMVSFANDIRTEGGVHVAAFHAAFTAALNEVGQKLGLLDGIVLTREGLRSRADRCRLRAIARPSVARCNQAATGQRGNRRAIGQRIEDLLRSLSRAELGHYSTCVGCRPPSQSVTSIGSLTSAACRQL